VRDLFGPVCGLIMLLIAVRLLLGSRGDRPKGVSERDWQEYKRRNGLK
jgi:hypothetical protein